MVAFLLYLLCACSFVESCVFTGKCLLLEVALVVKNLPANTRDTSVCYSSWATKSWTRLRVCVLVHAHRHTHTHAHLLFVKWQTAYLVKSYALFY